MYENVDCSPEVKKYICLKSLDGVSVLNSWGSIEHQSETTMATTGHPPCPVLEQS